MGRSFLELFNSKLMNVGYKSRQEYLNDSIKRVKMIIDRYRLCLLQGKINQAREKVLEEYALAELYIACRLEKTDKMIAVPAYHIRDCFSFSDLEWTCFLISMLYSIDNYYKKVILEIAKRDRQDYLSYEIVMKIFYFVEHIDEIQDGYDKLMDISFRMSCLCFSKDSMQIDRNILHFVTSGEKKFSISGTEVYLPDVDSKGILPIREEMAEKIKNISQKKLDDKQFCFYLCGEYGIGKKTLVKRASELMVKGTVIIDLKLYVSFDKDTFFRLIYSPLREALIVNGTICLDHFEIFDEMTSQKYEYLEFLMENVPRFSKEVFILSNNQFSKLPKKNSLFFVTIPVEKLNHKENFDMWNSSVKEISEITDVSARQLANKFHFTPFQTASSINSAKSLWYWKGQQKLDMKDMCRCAYANSISKISNKSTLISVKYNWDDLILDEREKNTIKNACSQIKYRHVVYEQWGMDKRITYGRGLSMLFSGPPGTGKTMAAQVVANELGLDIYKANLSEVVSKYIGETEKNLNELFDEAKKSNVILFFDETDAILGKRTEVKDSHDKNANIETSFLLQKMEEFDGITIMTTNYLENIDRAFFRRISYVVHFASPDEEFREKIWRSMFPEKIPIGQDVNFKYLAKNFEITGGSIKNIAVNAAFLAACENKSIEMQHILKSLIDELKKQGKNVIKDDLGEYAYLLS